MAATWVGPANTGLDALASSTLSGPQTVNAGSSLVAIARILVRDNLKTATVTGVTYNSVSMTLVGNTGYAAGGNGIIDAWLFTLVAPATGSNTLAVTCSSTADEIEADIVTVSGADQTTPVRPGSFTSFGNISVTSGAVAIPSSTSDVTISISGNGITFSPTTTQTLDALFGTTWCGGASDHGTTPAATVTHTWDIGGSPGLLMIAGASIQPVIVVADPLQGAFIIG